MSKIKILLFKLLTNPLVLGKEKAVAAAAVVFVASFAAQHLGYHLSDGLQQVVVSAILGGLAHLVVYLTPNRTN